MRRGIIRTLTGKINFATVFAPIINVTKGFLQKKFLKRSLETTSGLEAEYCNPDSMLDAKGKDLTFYDTMMLDSEIKGAIELKKTLVLSSDWSIVAGGEEDADIEISQFVKDVIDGLEISFDDSLDNTLDSMVYGFKIGELIWNNEPVDGKFTWRKFKFMHSVLFDFKYDEFDDLEEVAIGRNVGSDLTVPVQEFNEKFVCMVWPYIKDGNYYGDSDLRELYVEYWQRFNIIRWRGVYLQGFSFKVPIITYDWKDMTSAELTALDTMFDNWQDMMRLKIPGNRDSISKELKGKFEVDWREVGSEKGAEQFTGTLNELGKDIRRKLLFPDKMGFTTDNTGALSQSEIFWKLFLKVVKKIHRRLEDIYNPKIKQLIDLNFPAVEEYPKFRFNEIDHAIEVQMLNMLLDKGVVDKRESWIRKKVDVPQLTKEEQEDIDEAKAQDVIDQQEKFAQENQVMNGGGENGSGLQPRNGIAGKPNDGKQPNNKPDNNPVDKNGSKKKFKTGVKPIDFDKIKQQLDDNENNFVRDYTEIHKAQSDRLIETVKRKKIIENKDLKELNKLNIQKGEFKKMFEVYYSKLYFEGKRDAAQEVMRKGRALKIEFKTEPVKCKLTEDELKWLDRSWIDSYVEGIGGLGKLTKEDKVYLTDLKDRAFRITGETSDKILKEAQQTIDTGIRGNLTPNAVIDKVAKTLDVNRSLALTIARTNSSDAYNTGRMNEFLSPEISPFIEAFQYNAIIDNSTTDFCASHDGQIISKSDPELGSIIPPNHFNCRSLLTTVMVGQDELVDNSPRWGQDTNIDGEKFDTNLASVRKPARGFGG